MSFSLRRFLFSSLALWILITIFGVYFLFHLKKQINFGVDLVGGTYITLEVQTNKAIESELEQRMQSLSGKLKKAEKEVPVTTIEGNVGYMTFKSEEAARAAEDFLIAQDARVPYSREGSRLKIELTKEEVATIKREAINGNIKVLESRLNPLGAGEISIVPQGDKNIVVELPNVHDIRQAKTMIGKTALLEIKMVEDQGSSEEEILKKHGGKLPDNMIVVPSKERGGHPHFYLVAKYTDINGRLLKDAFSDVGGDFGTQPVVRFMFKNEGAEKFYELTSKNLGRQIAVLIDGVVITAPVVQSAIGAEGQITGNFTPEEARDLAALLKSGAFVAPVTFEEERHIGPSLGYQSIRSGLIACIVGLMALLLFAVLVYKTSGFFAFIVLLYNILLILFMMSWIKATLTLPGIAGMLLTIGMAIDASILIYERIREELAVGVPFRKALNTGFSGALSVILDANITHFLVAVVLYKFGAGPIRGFAIAMIIGIISTLITGILLLRSIFNFVLDGLGYNEVSI